MSTFRRPDAVALQQVTPRPSGYWRRLRALSIILLLSLVPSIEAQVANAQRAIEKLENCSDQERKNDCINILKRESASGDKEAIKAQVRGSRIIWYEYDKKTGSLRRTN